MIMDDKTGAQAFHHSMCEGKHDPPNINEKHTEFLSNTPHRPGTEQMFISLRVENKQSEYRSLPIAHAEREMGWSCKWLQILRVFRRFLAIMPEKEGRG